MKIFYLNFADFADPKNRGLIKKQESEMKVLAQNFQVGYMELKGSVFKFIDSKEVYTFTTKSEKFIQIKKRYIVYNHLLEFLTRNKYDVLYLRYNLSDMFLISFLKKLKKLNITVITQIATYPYLLELNSIVRMIDQRYVGKLQGLVSRIITYSEDDTIYNIPTIKIKNGVDYESISVKKSYNKEGVINLIGVASLAPWHGYDRVIKSLEEFYLKDNGDLMVNFYIVGTGQVTEIYKNMIGSSPIKNILEEHIFFEGYKSGKELDDLFDKCDIGVEVLAMHRKGLSCSSSLKSKEYFAKGLPFIAGSVMDIDGTILDEYYFQIDATDDTFDIEKILEEYFVLLEKYSLDLLAEVIRKNSREYCDIYFTLNPVIEYLETLNNR